MSVVDIIPVLQALGTQNPDAQSQQQRVQAEEHLKTMEENNFSGLMASLVTALNANDAVASQMAGLYMKNVLTGQSASITESKMQRWLSVDAQTRIGVKQGVGSALNSQEKAVSQAAAQIIAKIGVIEVPRGEWNELIDTLIEMSKSQESSKLSALQALGYLCEDLDETSVSPQQTNQILTAIVNGISTGQTDDIKFAAIKALRDSLKFAEENFGRQHERDMLLTQILGATQYKPQIQGGQDIGLEIRKTAFECCAIICDRYYSQLSPYIESMWQNSVQAITSDEEQIGLQALEVWTTIAEVEYEMMEEYEEQNACLNLIRTIHTQLVQLLLQCMTKQEEDSDEDDWGLSSSAALCLEAVTITVGRDVFPAVFNFVKNNLQNPDWHFKEAAIMALGNIFTETTDSDDDLVETAEQCLEMLLNLTRDQHALVKDSAVWCVSRLAPVVAMKPQYVQALVKSSLELMGDIPKIAGRAVCTLHNVALVFEEAEDKDKEEILSVFYKAVMEKLVVTMNRPDCEVSNLKGQTVEALSEFITVAPPSQLPLVFELNMHMLTCLEQSVQTCFTDSNTVNVECPNQRYFCILVNSAIQLLRDDPRFCQPNEFTDRIMKAFLMCLQIPKSIAHEDCYLAIGSMVNALNEGFERYVLSLIPFVQTHLQEHESYQVCAVVVGIICDLCGCLPLAFKMHMCSNDFAFMDQTMKLIVANLGNSELNRSVKPLLIGVSGDVAIALGDQFPRYIGHVVNIFMAAVGNEYGEDEDMIEYKNQIYEGVFESLSSIVIGLKGEESDPSSNKLPAFQEFVPKCLEMIAKVVEETDTDESVLKCCCALLGDIAEPFGGAFKNDIMRFQASFEKLIKECSEFEDVTAKEHAFNTKQILTKVCA